MPMKDDHLHQMPIPADLQIFEERQQVVDVHHRQAEAMRFARAKNKWLELEREPDNKHDANAIKVIGCSKWWFFKERQHIGYVERDVAREIVQGGWWGRVQPRLLKAHVSAQGPIEIWFQLLGPKGLKRSYDRIGLISADTTGGDSEDGDADVDGDE